MSEEQKPDKIKILAWGDYCCSTGFGTVMSNIMMQLQATGRYEIDVIGINYSGDPYDTERWPGRVYPAMPGLMSQGSIYSDVYGRQRLLDQAGAGDYDVIFMLQDTFILQTIMEPLVETQKALQKVPGKKSFTTVYYFPIDATPKPDWATGVVDKVDFPVAYTHYGRDAVKEFIPAKEIEVLYHGTNLKDFHPIEDEEVVRLFRKKYFNGLADDRPLMVNVNRNQPRKDIARSLMVLAEIKKRGYNPLLYMHMQHSDIGGNIHVMAQQLGLKNEEDFVCPHPNTFTANQGLKIDAVNMIYNAADMLLTTTLGEGWGLSVTEAMATKTPVIAPNNTSLTEMLADNRGMLVPSGNNPSMFVTKENDMERIRPVMDVEGAADAYEKIVNGEGPDLEGAFKFAQAFNWNYLGQEWVKIVDRAAAQSQVTNAKNEFARPMNRAERRKAKRKNRK